MHATRHDIGFRRGSSRTSVAFVMTIAMGLASRRFPGMFPPILGNYPGDAFWAKAAYWAVAGLRPAIPIRHAAASALMISFAVEASQHYHNSWVDAVRRTLFGRLILGSGFDLLDLVAYCSGVTLAAAADRWFVSRVPERCKRTDA